MQVRKAVVVASVAVLVSWGAVSQSEAGPPRLGASRFGGYRGYARSRGFVGRTRGYPGYGFARRDYRPFGGGFGTGYHYGHYQNGTSAYHYSNPRVTTGRGFRRGYSGSSRRYYGGSPTLRSRSRGYRSFRSRYGRR